MAIDERQVQECSSRSGWNLNSSRLLRWSSRDMPSSIVQHFLVTSFTHQICKVCFTIESEFLKHPVFRSLWAWRGLSSRNLSHLVAELQIAAAQLACSLIMIDYRLVFLSLREGQYDDPCWIWACNPTRSRWLSYHIYMLRGIGLLDFLRNKRWSTSPRGSPKARLDSRDALPAMILSVETGNWWESLIHPLQHVAQDLFDPKSAQPCFSWGREANPFKSFATSLRRRAVGFEFARSFGFACQAKKAGTFVGAFLDRGESNAGFYMQLEYTCNELPNLANLDLVWPPVLDPDDTTLGSWPKDWSASSIARAIACGKILRFDRSKVGAL